MLPPSSALANFYTKPTTPADRGPSIRLISHRSPSVRQSEQSKGAPLTHFLRFLLLVTWKILARESRLRNDKIGESRLRNDRVAQRWHNTRVPRASVDDCRQGTVRAGLAGGFRDRRRKRRRNTTTLPQRQREEKREKSSKEVYARSRILQHNYRLHKKQQNMKVRILSAQ